MISLNQQENLSSFDFSKNTPIVKNNEKTVDKHNDVIIKPLTLKIHPNTKNKIEIIPIVISPPQFQTLSIQVHLILYLYQNTKFVHRLTKYTSIF